MTKKILFISIPLLLLLFTVTTRSRVPGTVRAVGDLAVDWGVPEGQPIFTISGLAPGQSVTRTVSVANGASSTRPLGIRGTKISETGNLSSVLNLKIKENGVLLHSLSLSQFFSDTVNPDTGLPFSDLDAGQSATYEFIVTFDPAADNSFQNQSVVFNLQIGIYVPLPQACENIRFTKGPIFGTSGNDRLRGGNGRQLIVSLEGNDNISGGNQGDCIVSGPGNDKISGGNSPDVITGDDGDDIITGGNGNDFIISGIGNDWVNGGNGHDQIYGDSGNDTLMGGNGNDTLEGGDGTDKTDGQLGTDTCTAESEFHCEL